MATGEVDLKTLLEHDFKMVQAIAGTSRLLVNDLDASHHWVTQSISLFTRLSNIALNVNSLLDTCEPFWDNKATAFSNPEAAKLWKTAAGLWSALPGEQKKFDDYVARRRRERIMGQGADEALELEEEQIVSDKAAYDLLLGEMDTTCAELLVQIAALPDGLVPKAPLEKKPANEENAASAGPGNAPEPEVASNNPETPPEPPTE